MSRKSDGLILILDGYTETRTPF